VPSGTGPAGQDLQDDAQGTHPRAAAAGKPLFGTLISLLHKGQPVLGIIDQPVLRERWVGVSGSPSTYNGRPISTRACGSLKEAYMYSTTPHMFSGASEAAWSKVRDAGEAVPPVLN
jgi:inositol-phosphate phosphatase/L-galactose 1-phosphate phosphatase/histidinol-phosphatase